MVYLIKQNHYCRRSIGHRNWIIKIKYFTVHVVSNQKLHSMFTFSLVFHVLSVLDRDACLVLDLSHCICILTAQYTTRRVICKSKQLCQRFEYFAIDFTLKYGATAYQAASKTLESGCLFKSLHFANCLLLVFRGLSIVRATIFNY